MEQIPGDGKTFFYHLTHGSVKQIFEHDIPKVLGIAQNDAKAIQAGWDKLSPEAQHSLLHASGIINEIAADLDSPAATILQAILSKFTDIKLDALKPWLAKVQGVFTGVEGAIDQDAAVSIENLQKYFKQYEGEKLSGVLSWISQALATVIKPDNVIGQVATYIETAYQIIKNLFGKK